MTAFQEDHWNATERGYPMVNFTLRKLLGMIPMLLIITFLIYAGIEMMPGDVIDFLIPMDQLAEMTPEEVAAFRAAKGLDGPMIVRYFNWLLGVCQGDLGYSLQNNVPVAQLMLQKMPATIELSLAALVISTILGIVLGMDIPSLVVFSSGFMAGAYAANPDVQIEVKAVGSFSDTSTAKELALALHDSGADIVYAAAGGSGLGVFNAAEEGGFLAIGSDVNQCPIKPAVIMVSGIRLCNATISNGIAAAMEGTLKGGSRTEGLAEAALTYATEGSEVVIDQAILDAAEVAREAIIKGEIIVPSTYEELGK